jgi:hypothetical protein
VSVSMVDNFLKVIINNFHSFNPIFASHTGSSLKSEVLKTYKQVGKEKGRAPNYIADS